jgi:AraC family transcriptional regulator of adaptative response/methylated-DNA-[protein]-cysteine methyltransferase
MCEVKHMNSSLQWQTVLARDARFDGAFVYAVRSTGIYCRPSCPSRKPQRKFVEFFPEPQQAERAGFRPCRRCLPQQAEQDPTTELVLGVCRYLDEHADEATRLAKVAARFGRSPFHLQRMFKRVLGISPRQYSEARRVARLKTELRARDNVTDALYQAGYGSSSRLYEHADQHLGMTPAAYKRGGRGVRIHYAVANCALGKLLVAGTERGVCWVAMDKDEGRLTSALRHGFPEAEVAQDESAVSGWMKPLLQHLEGLLPDLRLPLDVQATAFQRRVWDLLRKIPYGSTRSYGEIARTLGNANAARAVARSCATNPVALAVPCHRVVRDDGSLGGYRWGIERKQALLERERQRQ